MIPVPWSQDEESAGGGVGLLVISLQLLQNSSHSSGFKPSSDMSVYLQHFLSVHNRVHMKRQAKQMTLMANKPKRQASSDTVRTEPAQRMCIASSHRIVPPSSPPSQNLIQSKSPLVAGSSNSRLPHAPPERVRAHTVGRSIVTEDGNHRVCTAPAEDDHRPADKARLVAAATRQRMLPQLTRNSMHQVKSAGICPSPRQPVAQALLVTNSSSNWSSAEHPPRPQKEDPATSGLRRKGLPSGAKDAPENDCAVGTKDITSSADDEVPTVIDRVDKIEQMPMPAMSQNLVERRRRIVQSTVQMELVAPERARRANRPPSGADAVIGAGTDKSAAAPTYRSVNIGARRTVLSGSITTTTGTPPSNYRFQQVGSNIPSNQRSRIVSQPNDLLRRVIKEVGTDSILDADQLELLMTTGRYMRLGEALEHGLRGDDLMRGIYKINSGTFCSVYLGRWLGQDVAVKCPHPNLVKNDPLMMTHRAVAEWRILSQMEHTNIVKLIGGIVLESEKAIWLITEYVHGGDIYNFLYHQQRPDVGLQGYRRLKLMEQLAEGLSYIHARRVVHKDIKCNNLLITNRDVLKICDFGDAEVLTGIHIQCCTAATWQYVSPELVCSEDPSRPMGATELVDVWAMGCVFLEMIKCPTPFFHLLENVPEGAQRDRLRSLFLQGTLEAEIRIPPNLPPRLRSVILRCLQFNASKRNTSYQILNYMRLHKSQLQSEIDMWLSRPLMRPPVLSPITTYQHVIGVPQLQPQAPVPVPSVPGATPNIVHIINNPTVIHQTPNAPRSGTIWSSFRNRAPPAASAQAPVMSPHPARGGGHIPLPGYHM